MGDYRNGFIDGVKEGKQQATSDILKKIKKLIEKRKESLNRLIGSGEEIFSIHDLEELKQKIQGVKGE